MISTENQSGVAADADSWRALAADPARLEALGREVLVLGRWSKADVHLLRLGADQKAVLKDYSRKLLPVRWLGAWQLTREARAYRRLAGLPGIPRCYGQPRKCAILLEYIEGRRLSACHNNDRFDIPALLTRLEGIIDRMQSAGFTHNDLRCRENILVRDRDQAIFLIDFSGVLTFPPGSLRRRFLFRFARTVDRGAWLKWKKKLAPEHLTEREQGELRRTESLRRLWFINRHKPKNN